MFWNKKKLMIVLLHQHIEKNVLKSSIKSKVDNQMSRIFLKSNISQLRTGFWQNVFRPQGVLQTQLEKSGFWIYTQIQFCLCLWKTTI